MECFSPTPTRSYQVLILHHSPGRILSGKQLCSRSTVPASAYKFLGTGKNCTPLSELVRSPWFPWRGRCFWRFGRPVRGSCTLVSFRFIMREFFTSSGFLYRGTYGVRSCRVLDDMLASRWHLPTDGGHFGKQQLCRWLPGPRDRPGPTRKHELVRYSFRKWYRECEDRSNMLTFSYSLVAALEAEV